MTSAHNPDLLSGPAYSAMVDDILAHIADGSLEVGQRLASEAMLKKQYGISINSIKRGLSLLVERGLLTRRRGSGTFVASTDITPVRPMVRRDTIAIVRQTEYWRYHPFFSEQNRGILAGLAQHGWKTHDLQFHDHGSPSAGRDISFRDLSPAVVDLELAQRPEGAGVLWVQGSGAAAQEVATAGHVVVCSGPSDSLPYVSYDWQAETERLFRIALAKGARTLGVISIAPREQLEGMCQRSARALGLDRDEVVLTCLSCAPTIHGAELINEAYSVTLAAFEKRPAFDGLIITSDFEAQGVTDALASLPHERWADLTVVALLNRESKLHARIPMTALISDGYAAGTAMADLLHEQITSGGDGVSGITLSCYQAEWR